MFLCVILVRHSLWRGISEGKMHAWNNALVGKMASGRQWKAKEAQQSKSADIHGPSRSKLSPNGRCVGVFVRPFQTKGQVEVVQIACQGLLVTRVGVLFSYLRYRNCLLLLSGTVAIITPYNLSIQASHQRHFAPVTEAGAARHGDPPEKAYGR